MPSDTTPTASICRPGERLIAGKVSVFNSDLLNAHLADLAVEAAPATLSDLSDAEVSKLWGAWMNRQRRMPLDALTVTVGDLVCNERAARPSLSGAYTGARQVRAAA